MDRVGTPAGYFYLGLIFTVFLTLLTPFIVYVPQGDSVRILMLIVFAHAHFIVAYLYYIDILRKNIPRMRYLFLFLAAFILIVCAYYFARYVWFVSLAIFISILTAIYFFVHHVIDIFYFREKFFGKQKLRRAKDTYLLLAYIVSFVSTFFVYAFWVMHRDTFIGISYVHLLLVFSYVVLFVSAVFLYRKGNAYTLLFIAFIPVVFLAPSILQKVSYDEVRFFLIFWHVFLWFIMYPLLLYLRNTATLEKKVRPQSGPLVSRFLNTTRANVRNFLLFYLSINVLVLVLYFSIAYVGGTPPLGDAMLKGHVLLGLAYIDLWTFAHITFSFFPKEVKQT